MDSLVQQFIELFDGNRGGYGSDAGPRAGSHHLNSGPTYYLLNESVFRRHLEGGEPIGVYPMVDRVPIDDAKPGGSWYVKWGCVDFDVRTKGKPSWDYDDEDEAHVASVNLQNVLRHLGVTSWIERTKSHGRHVWIFSDSWVAASTMRRGLLVACSVAGVSTREVNPKQEQLADGQLGNYVRLPYPGCAPTGKWDTNRLPADETRVMLRDGLLMGLSQFLERALTHRTSPALLASIAAKYVEPPAPPKLDFTRSPSDMLCDAIRGYNQLNAAGRAVFTNGPEDGDRSRALGYVAWQARESGLGPADAYALIDDAAARWGKFDGRRDREQRLTEIVERAWR